MEQSTKTNHFKELIKSTGLGENTAKKFLDVVIGRYFTDSEMTSEEIYEDLAKWNERKPSDLVMYTDLDVWAGADDLTVNQLLESIQFDVKALSELFSDLLKHRNELAQLVNELRHLLGSSLGDDKANGLRDSLMKYCPELEVVLSRANESLAKL